MRNYSVAVGLLFLGTTLGAIFAPELIPLPSGEELGAKRVAWGIWKGWVVSPILYFWVLLQSIQTSKQVDKLMKSFMYSGALLVMVSYGFGGWYEGFSDDGRLRGLFESANYLSLYLSPAFLLATYFLFQRKKLRRGEFYLNGGAWLILALGLFFTQSYGAFLGIFGALGLYVLVLLFKKPTWHKKLTISLVGVVILFGALLASQWNTPKFQQMLDFSGRSSSSVRIEIYRTSLHMIAEKPFLGFGPGLFEANYQINAPEVLGQAPLEWNMPHPHNVFLAFWLNAGLLGFLALILLIVLVHGGFTYPLVALWGVLIHGLVDVPFWKNDLAVIFWLLVVGVVVLQGVGKKNLCGK